VTAMARTVRVREPKPATGKGRNGSTGEQSAPASGSARGGRQGSTDLARAGRSGR
jgi:hypothetical protein